MASPAYSTRPARSHQRHSAASHPHVKVNVSNGTRNVVLSRDATSVSSGTVFDLLYNTYLPFRLYTDYMLGSSAAELARQFALPEHWVSERIEAVRLCGKQVRLNLLDSASQPNPAH